MNRTLFALGSLMAFLAVGLGAFGTHALRDRLSQDMLEVWRTGVQYQMIHAVGCLIAAQNADSIKGAKLAGWLFVGGIVVFSGSLYLLAITEVRILGAITPLGGLGFLSGWAMLGFGALRSQNSR